jgi:hypothetical protein
MIIFLHKHYNWDFEDILNFPEVRLKLKAYERDSKETTRLQKLLHTRHRHCSTYK